MKTQIQIHRSKVLLWVSSVCHLGIVLLYGQHTLIVLNIKYITLSIYR